jgi:hypothetical protein
MKTYSPADEESRTMMPTLPLDEVDASRVDHSAV